ncbi:hypothetical protein RCOM_1077730 [Ricinus communis]|uniref:Uncharacterized protein n=1 Tax=Ricinus communis TaxID=3988 RepID=B9RM53_RICCO|nr:hypothetical protein RCOM_1077730 [Ricinus communis]
MNITSVVSVLHGQHITRYANRTVLESLNSLNLTDAKAGIAKYCPSTLGMTLVQAFEAVVNEFRGTECLATVANRFKGKSQVIAISTRNGLCGPHENEDDCIYTSMKQEQQFTRQIQIQVPMFVGEIGLDQRGLSQTEEHYYSCVLAYLADFDMDWAWWTWPGSYYYLHTSELKSERTMALICKPILSTDCSSQLSLWSEIDHLHLAAAVGEKGEPLCLQKESPYTSKILTSKCIFTQEDPACRKDPQKDPTSQWFKLVRTNIQ